MKKMFLAGMVSVVMAMQLSASDIVGTINGMAVTKDDIAQVLRIVDKSGTMQWDKLDKAKKLEFLKMLAPSKIMAKKAEKELTQAEKEAALGGYWMQKALQNTKVDEKELKDAYEKIKSSYTGGDAKKAQQFPPFEVLKPQIEMKLKQDKLIENVMKDAKIELK